MSIYCILFLPTVTNKENHKNRHTNLDNWIALYDHKSLLPWNINLIDEKYVEFRAKIIHPRCRNWGYNKRKIASKKDKISSLLVEETEKGYVE